MGRTVYLPTWMADLYGFHVGKYTVRPMDPLGMNHHVYFSSTPGFQGFQAGPGIPVGIDPKNVKICQGDC